jgi:hypothetical protein
MPIAFLFKRSHKLFLELLGQRSGPGFAAAMLAGSLDIGAISWH